MPYFEKKWAQISLVLASFVGIGAALLALFAYFSVGFIETSIKTTLEDLKSKKTSRFFVFPASFEIHKSYALDSTQSQLEFLGFTPVDSLRALTRQTYYLERATPSILHLYIHRGELQIPGFPLKASLVKMQWENKGSMWEVTQMWNFPNLQEISTFMLPPRELGFYLSGRVRKQHSVPLSKIPVNLRLAVIAIEDGQFLNHHGVSLRGTARALWKDLIAMKWVQGGSTITQQLMKQLFFSKEKVISRKIQEALYAFIAEATLEKEDILEAYLNEVYLGQQSSRAIHGVSEASLYYFGIPVGELSLNQSAMLAAMIQRPNYFDPRRHPERLERRKNFVLSRMEEEQFILQTEYRLASQKPVEVLPVAEVLDDAGYFMDLALREIPEDLLERLQDEPLTIYLSMDPYLQDITSTSLLAHLNSLESSYKSLLDRKKAGIPLQGAMIVARPSTCEVLAVQGGRNFEKSPFNRALQGKRQPGSLLKPFVYLTAFEDKQSDPRFTPITLLKDEPFTWEYDGQTWSPQNYDKQYRGEIPLYQALAQSINVPAARVAQNIGIEKIRATLLKAGVNAKIPAVPSLSLGSAEITPFEMAQLYSTLARLGDYCPLKTVQKIYSAEGEILYENLASHEQVWEKEASFQVVDILKRVFTEGTAISAQQANLPTSMLAGKTGTSNDYNDAWFVGFGPELLTLVWIGYDSQETAGLTGATGALPVWIKVMEKIQPYLEMSDFRAPSDLRREKIDPQTWMRWTPQCRAKHEEFFFYSGTEPQRTCQDLLRN